MVIIVLGIAGAIALLFQQWPEAIAIGAVLIAVCVMGSLLIAFYVLDMERSRAVTISFLTLAFGKLWFVFNLRSPGTGMLDNDVVQNPYVIGAILLCIGLLVAAVYAPQAFRTGLCGPGHVGKGGVDSRIQRLQIHPGRGDRGFP